MRSAFAVLLKGFTLPFGATSGRRIVFDGVAGQVDFYDTNGDLRIRIGGPTAPEFIQWRTANPSETAAAGIGSQVFGASANEMGTLVITSPAFGGDATEIQLRSESEGGTIPAQIRLGNGQSPQPQRLAIDDGADKAMGIATLVAGTVTVANVTVTANSRIFLTSQVDGGTPGFLRVTARVAGTSFTITSSNAADTSQVAWLIFEPF